MVFRSLRTLVALTTIALIGCATDTVSAPPSAADAPATPLFVLLNAPHQIKPLLRRTPLVGNLTAAATLGVRGGSISIPGAGLLVFIPPRAVAPGTTITVTALAGSNVAYEFAPHGLRFALPLVAIQSLGDVITPVAGLQSLSLGYFPDPAHVTTVTELLDVKVDRRHLTAATAIWHFSGYIYASGEK